MLTIRLKVQTLTRCRGVGKVEGSSFARCMVKSNDISFTSRLPNIVDLAKLVFAYPNMILLTHQFLNLAY